MNPVEFRVRRATIDDLAVLVALWESMRLTPADLERRLTEFQVVEDPEGAVVGAIAMEISGQQGRIHSECFKDFSMADDFRGRLWTRLQNVASNHGLARLWTHEDVPYWKQIGFVQPGVEDLKKLPPGWSSFPPDWMTLRLKAEEAFSTPVEAEFLHFKELERARTERALQNARVLKQVATGVALILALVIGVISIYVMMKNRGRLPGH